MLSPCSMMWTESLTGLYAAVADRLLLRVKSFSYKRVTPVLLCLIVLKSTSGAVLFPWIKNECWIIKSYQRLIPATLQKASSIDLIFLAVCKSTGLHILLFSFAMDYDEVLKEIGEFGPWQKKLMVILWAPILVVGLAFMTYSFALGTPAGYRCFVPGCDTEGEKNEFRPDWVNRFIPPDVPGIVSYIFSYSPLKRLQIWEEKEAILFLLCLKISRLCLTPRHKMCIFWGSSL